MEVTFIFLFSVLFDTFLLLWYYLLLFIFIFHSYLACHRVLFWRWYRTVLPAARWMQSHESKVLILMFLVISGAVVVLLSRCFTAVKSTPETCMKMHRYNLKNNYKHLFSFKPRNSTLQYSRRCSVSFSYCLHFPSPESSTVLYFVIIIFF